MDVQVRFKKSGATGTLSVNSEEELQQELLNISNANPGDELEVVDSGMGGSALRGGWQGLTFNAGDELAGLGAAIMPGGQGYTEARDEARLKNEVARLSNPKTYAASEFGSGFLVPGVGYAKAAQNLNKLQKYGRMAATGGGTGLAVGLGSADELDAEGWTDAGTSAVIGAVASPLVGGIANKAADYVGDLGQGVKRLMYTEPREQAERWLGRHMDPSIDSPDVLKGMLSARGQDTRLMELDEGMLRMAQQSKMGGPTSDRIIAENINPIRDRAVGRIRGAINESMPDEIPYKRLKKFINDPKMAREKYDLAYQDDFTPDEWVQRQWEHSPTWRRIAGKVQESMLDKDIDRLSIRDIDELPGVVPIEYMHRFLGHMRGQINKLYREGDSHSATELLKIHRTLDQKVKTQSPAFQGAQQFYRSKMDIKEAMEFGRDVYSGKMQPDILEDLMEDYSELEMKGFRTGLLQAMLDRAGEITQTGNTGNKVFQNHRIKEVIREGMQNPDKFEDLVSFMAQEQNKSRAHTRLLNNSVTSQTLGGDQRLPEGGPMSVIRQMLDKVLHQEMTPAEWHEVSKIMTGELTEDQIDRLFAKTAAAKFLSPVPEAIGAGASIAIGQAAGREY
jgi:hypothetical protein